METLKKLFLLDKRGGEPSHTKFWSNIGYLAMIFSYLYAAINETTIDPILMLMFGGIVIGNRSLLKIANIIGEKYKIEQIKKDIE